LSDSRSHRIDADLRVFALVPLPAQAGGARELLALSSEGGDWTLPVAAVNPGERIFAAARRIARETAGLAVLPERLVYFLEDERGSAWVVLCAADFDAEPGEAAGKVQFVDPGALPGILEPDVLRELLVEDLAAGFMRPMAHVTVDTRESPAVTVIW